MIILIYSLILNLNLSRCNLSGAECNVPFSALKSYSVLGLLASVSFLISRASRFSPSLYIIWFLTLPGTMVVTIVITGISPYCVIGISCDHLHTHGYNSHCLLTNVSIGACRPWYEKSCLLNCDKLLMCLLSIMLGRSWRLLFYCLSHIM